MLEGWLWFSHADLYKLAIHQERCKPKPVATRETSFRFSLTKSAEEGAPPVVIIVDRSSSEASTVLEGGHWRHQDGPSDHWKTCPKPLRCAEWF